MLPPVGMPPCVKLFGGSFKSSLEEGHGLRSELIFQLLNTEGGLLPILFEAPTDPDIML